MASEAESVASNSLEAPNRKRKQSESTMSTSGRRAFVEGMRWTNNLEIIFIDIMYDEVIRGNLLGSTFTPGVWTDIQHKLKDQTGHNFSIKQMREKLSRIKMNWRKYKNLMLSDTDLGWDHERDVPLADDNWWQIYLQAKPKDSCLRNKPCKGYIKLCTLFERNTASGSCARSSSQRPPAVNISNSIPVEEPIHLNAKDEDAATTAANTHVPLGFEPESCSSRRRKGKKQVLDRLINSFETASNSISSELIDKKLEKQCIAIVDALRELPDVSLDLMVKAVKYFDQPARQYMFLALSSREQRAVLDEI